MLTKTGNAYRARMEKDASGLGLLATYLLKPAGMHIGQNVITGNALGSLRPNRLVGAEKMLHPVDALKQYSGKRIGRNLIARFMGKEPGVVAGVGHGLGGVVSPELSILADEFGQAGKKFREALAGRGLDLSSLSKRDIVSIRRILRGDFRKALDNPSQQRMLADIVESLHPGSGKHVETFLQAGGKGAFFRDEIEAALKGAEDLYKTNPLTRQLANGIGANLNAKTLAKLHARKDGTGKGLAVARTVEALGNGVLAWHEPAAAALNATKRILASPLADNMLKSEVKALRVPGKGLKHVENYVNDRFVLQPVYKSFREGLSGGQQRLLHNDHRFSQAVNKRFGTRAWRPVGDMVKNYGFNYVSGNAQDFGYQLGKKLNRVGIDANFVDTMTDIARQAKREGLLKFD